MGSEVGHSIRRQQIPEYELERAFNRNCHAEGSMDKKSFVNAVTEILFKLGVEVTEEPSELDRALAGDKEAARKVLMGMGVIDRDGSLTENYAPLPEEKPDSLNSDFWVIMHWREEGVKLPYRSQGQGGCSFSNHLVQSYGTRTFPTYREAYDYLEREVFPSSPKARVMRVTSEPRSVGHEFWVVMQKRNDGCVYADLHKTDGIMYLEFKDAIVALNKHPQKECYHIVKMIANLEGL